MLLLWFRLRSYNSNRIANSVFQWSMIMVESLYKNWCWRLLLVITVQVPALFSVNIPNGVPVTTSLFFIKKKELHILPVLCWPHSALARDVGCLPLAVGLGNRYVSYVIIVKLKLNFIL